MHPLRCIGEETQRAGGGPTSLGLGITCHNDICLPYYSPYAREEPAPRACWASYRSASLTSASRDERESALTSLDVTRAIRDAPTIQRKRAPRSLHHNGINATGA